MLDLAMREKGLHQVIYLLLLQNALLPQSPKAFSRDSVNKDIEQLC
jgi:hypothetical protein